MHPLPYIIFFVVLFLWWGWKVVQHNFEAIQQRKLTQALEDIKQGLNDIKDEVKMFKDSKAKTKDKEVQ